jgi:UDP-N-acetylglucosamine--N-acetylmuramyl-(pentapeptide) pyrophosphoryl-undecaprenol N-acetylglucosamine transferase
LSTGGRTSVPIFLAARLLGIPLCIQEQNVLPGAANRLGAKLAREVFLSFPESLQYLRGTVVGNPVRREILRAEREPARKALRLTGRKKILLVMGGSQGARSINQAIIDSLSALDGERWEVIHLVGQRDYSSTALPERPFYHPQAYLYNVGEVLAAADLVVSRAGASAIAEFTARGLPMILVPYPFAAERHQELNAAAAETAGAAIVIKDEKLNPASFISALTDAESELPAMGAAARRLGRPEAAQLIAERILKIK